MRIWNAILTAFLTFALFTLGARYVWGVPYTPRLRQDPRWRLSWRECLMWGIVTGLAFGVLVYVKKVHW